MNKLLRALCLVLVLALVSVSAMMEAPASDDPVLATLNGSPLYLSDVEYYAQQLAAYGYIETVDDIEGATEYALLYYLLPRVKVFELGAENILGDAYAESVAAAEQEYEAAIDTYVTYFAEEGADEETLATLREEAIAYYAEEGFDKDAYAEEMLIGYAYNALLASLNFTVTEEEIMAEYNKAVEQYESYFATNIDMYEYYVNYYGYDIPYRPEGYRGVQHILLTTTDELSAAYENAADEEASAAAAQAIIANAQETIDAIYARLEAGESFEALIAEYNDDPGMSGDSLVNGYAVHKDSILYYPEFTAGSFSEEMQNVGDVSKPVVTKYGVHIIRYLRDIPAGAEPISEDAHESIENYLLEGAEEAQIKAWLAECDVQYTEAYHNLIAK